MNSEINHSLGNAKPNQDFLPIETAAAMSEDKENDSNNASPSSMASSSMDVERLKERENDVSSVARASSAGKEEENGSSSSEEESEEESESDEESVADPHLSDYERLRLRNIRRNEARLAQLGLLVPGETQNSALLSASQTESQSALTSLLGTSGKTRGRPSMYKKRPKSMEATRVLPRRLAKSKKRYDLTSPEPADKKARNKRKASKRQFLPSKPSHAAHEFSDDDSMTPSPIQPSKIIKPQSHQKDFHDNKKFYLKQRRNRRGRPKRDEYIYVCEERCGFCGGGWGEIVDVENGTCNEEKMGGEGVEVVDKVVPIDVELLDDEEVKLIRCKDCRGAFHPQCILLNGKVDDKDDGCGACCPEDAQSQDEALSNICAPANSNNGTSEETGGVAMEVECQTMQVPTTTNSGGNADDAQEMQPTDENTKSVKWNNDETLNTVEAKAVVELGSTQPMEVVCDQRDGNGAVAIQSMAIDGTSRGPVPTKTQDTTSGMICDRKSVEGVDAIVSESFSKDETKPDDCTPVGSTDNVDDQESHRYVRIHHPKRCCKCDAIHKSGLNQDSGNKRRCDSSEEREPPLKKRRVFKLEAIIGSKTVMCSIEPTPVLEAEVDGKSIACLIMFDDNKNKQNALIGEGIVGLEQAAVKITQKPKIRTSVTKDSDPIVRKVKKIVSKATDRISDAGLQESSIVALRSYVDGNDSSASVMKAGACEMLSNAMTNHPMIPSIQVESIKTMSEIVWYNESLAEELVQQGCLELTISAMDSHGSNPEVQHMGCELFRALSYDSKSAKAMFEANVVSAVVKSMQHNQKDLDTLTEGSCFIQNMMVVSFDTVSILLETTRGDNSADILSVLVNAIKDNQDCVELVAAACDVLANVSLDAKGAPRIARFSGGTVLHKLILPNSAFQEHAEVLLSAVSTLYNLAWSSSTLLNKLVKADCASNVLALLNSSARDPTLYTVSFGLLKELAVADNNAKEKISNSVVVSMVLDAIRHYSSIELLLNAFSLLKSVTIPTDKQLTINMAKRILQSMEDLPDEESIQSDGCQILLHAIIALPESRALKSLVRTGSSKVILKLAMKSFPSSCKDAHRLICGSE